MLPHEFLLIYRSTPKTRQEVYTLPGQSAMAGFNTKGHFYWLSFGSTSLGIHQAQVPCSGVFQTYIHSRAYMLHNTCDRLCYWNLYSVLLMSYVITA